MSERKPWRPTLAQVLMAGGFLVAAAFENLHAVTMVGIGLGLTIGLDIWIWSRHDL